jgi:hypothetical protein
MKFLLGDHLIYNFVVLAKNEGLLKITYLVNLNLKSEIRLKCNKNKKKSLPNLSNLSCVVQVH